MTLEKRAEERWNVGEMDTGRERGVATLITKSLFVVSLLMLLPLCVPEGGILN